MENFTGQQPVDETNGELALVVARDGNVDVLEGGVGMAEGDGGDIDVGGLTEGLVIETGICDNQEPGLKEL